MEDDSYESMNDSAESLAQGAARRWLLLLHQLPPKPDYIRVKVRRRLRRLGAVSLKNSVYVLPESDEHLEDLQWLANEIVADGGEATICSATMLSGVTDDELAALFPDGPAGIAQSAEAFAHAPKAAVWVTRQNVFIDRVASAWLIRRFIDPEARFKFVPARGYQPGPRELRFDMYQGEFTHVGDRCTFETLLLRFELRDSALRAIGEIVHDLDLKDDKFERPETRGVLALVEGVAKEVSDDVERIGRAAVIFDALYSRLRRGR